MGLTKSERGVNYDSDKVNLRRDKCCSYIWNCSLRPKTRQHTSHKGTKSKDHWFWTFKGLHIRMSEDKSWKSFVLCSRNSHFSWNLHREMRHLVYRNHLVQYSYRRFSFWDWCEKELHWESSLDCLKANLGYNWRGKSLSQLRNTILLQRWSKWFA